MNKKYIQQAIELSKQSFDASKFPAGAVLVHNNEIIESSTSSEYPNQHLHAETKVIDRAIAKIGDQLTNYELYTSLQLCLMCFGKIYWSGISKVYYVLSRDDVDTALSYEGTHKTKDLIKKLNKDIQFIQDKTYHNEALEVYSAWEWRMRL